MLSQILLYALPWSRTSWIKKVYTGRNYQIQKLSQPRLQIIQLQLRIVSTIFWKDPVVATLSLIIWSCISNVQISCKEGWRNINRKDSIIWLFNQLTYLLVQVSWGNQGILIHCLILPLLFLSIYDNSSIASGVLWLFGKLYINFSKTVIIRGPQFLYKNFI